MNTLTSWMATREMRDGELAELVGLSQPQLSRIRRGKSGTRPEKAKRLEAVTGIPWHEFVDPHGTTP